MLRINTEITVITARINWHTEKTAGTHSIRDSVKISVVSVSDSHNKYNLPQLSLTDTL